ncbi:MAG: RNA polymerase sigma factor, partial [Proteobacteria bacterium]
HQHAGTVRRILARMVHANDLDDLVQDVFLRIYRFSDSFREESDIKTWVHRICVNTVQDHYRKRKWTNILSFSSESTPEPAAKDDQGADTENQNFVEKALHKLSVKERIVVVLFYLEDVPVEEIAKTLNLPEGTIKSRLHTARTKLQNFMKKEGVEL